MSAALGNLQGSITALTAQLVRAKSRASIDPIDHVADAVSTWCEDNKLRVEYLKSANDLRGLLIRVAGTSVRPSVLLNACLDTADFGDVAQWEHSPVSATIAGDWLYGRGSADSKIGVAIFLHLAAAFTEAPQFKGQLLVYLDADEHTGTMQGMRAFQQKRLPVDFAMIGYPGRDRVMIGARGFLRIAASVYGVSSHSGSRSVSQSNAIAKAACLVTSLSSDTFLPKNSNASLAPKVTVTGIEGGGSFTLVPDKCRVSIDIRLTDAFPVEAARTQVTQALNDLDSAFPTGKPTEICEINHLPFYKLDETNKWCQTLLRAAKSQFGPSLSFGVSGPSNIGNLLAVGGIPATCGFGVDYRNIHAANECAFLPDIAPVFRAYQAALMSYFAKK